jgi:hypothetical protein
MRFKATLPTILVIVCLAFASGCSNNPLPEVSADDIHRYKLEEVWGAYNLHVLEKSRPPKSLRDLHTYELGYTAGMAAVKENAIVVRWQTKVGDGSVVLAHMKDAANEGGLVLFSDGTIKPLTAGEFQEAINKR